MPALGCSAAWQYAPIAALSAVVGARSRSRPRASSSGTWQDARLFAAAAGRPVVLPAQRSLLGTIVCRHGGLPAAAPARRLVGPVGRAGGWDERVVRLSGNADMATRTWQRGHGNAELGRPCAVLPGPPPKIGPRGDAPAPRPCKRAGYAPANSMNFIRFSDLCAQGRCAGQRVFIRADLNVPQDDNGRITEDTRIRASVPCHANGAGRRRGRDGHQPPGPPHRRRSSSPLTRWPRWPSAWASCWAGRCRWWPNWTDGVQPCSPGNWCCWRTAASTRARRKTSEELARKMAALCDIFVHDAFGTAHRAEGTTYGIAQFAPVACAGPLLAAEMDAISKALAQPKRPLVAIVAGSKVSTKLTILQSLAGQGGPADCGRRHCQHLHAGRRPAHRQKPGRARPAGRGPGRDCRHEGARRRSAYPHRCGGGQDLRRRRVATVKSQPARWRTTT
jgi:hypothetical protein